MSTTPKNRKPTKTRDGAHWFDCLISIFVGVCLLNVGYWALSGWYFEKDVLLEACKGMISTAVCALLGMAGYYMSRLFAIREQRTNK